MPTYYTTQSRLALRIARECFDNKHHVFVATRYNAAENHPTSNPDYVRSLWCEVTSLTDTAYESLFTAVGTLRDEANLDGYPAIGQWFEAHVDGGSQHDHERWYAHVNSLYGIVERYLLGNGNIGDYLHALTLLAKAERTIDGLPVIYCILVDESREQDSSFDPGPNYANNKECIIPNLDVSVDSTEVKMVEVNDFPCEVVVDEAKLPRP